MTLNKRRALVQLEQARLHLERGEWEHVEKLVREVRDAGFTELAVFSLLGEALRQLGQREESKTILEAGLVEHPGAGELEGRLGCVWLDLEEPAKAVEYLARAQKKRPRDSALLTSYAAALLRIGKAEEAEAQLARALLVGAGPDARLVLATTKARRGQFDEAERIATKVEGFGIESLTWAARALRAEIRLLRGDAMGSLKTFQSLEVAGQLQPWQLSHMALAAELAGQTEITNTLMSRRVDQAAGPEDLVLFASIATLRGDAKKALEHLARAKELVKVVDSAWTYEFLCTQGRALRIDGQNAEARAVLEEAVGMAEAEYQYIGAPPFIDLGHLAADTGDFEQAEVHFRRALTLDANEPEAKRGLELAMRRLGWRQAVEADAEQKVARARAEAEAVRRRFVVRETEVERMRREIEQLKAQRTQAEKEVQRVNAQVETERAKLESASRTKLREELEQRQTDVEAKALENLESVFGTRRDACPEKLWQMLLVAERTFQQSLYTEIPAAAVAVLFSGAFERSLVELFAQGFDRWLDRQGLRTRFLEDGVRERRGSRVEYFDRFFDWFDREQNSRAPALGEIARVLDRRSEPYLAPFELFLTSSFALEPAFWDEFTKFVTWGKETLRDPVAHGHIEIDWDGLKVFREKLLFEFGGQKPGALPRLMRARKK